MNITSWIFLLILILLPPLPSPGWVFSLRVHRSVCDPEHQPGAEQLWLGGSTGAEGGLWHVSEAPGPWHHIPAAHFYREEGWFTFCSSGKKKVFYRRRTVQSNREIIQPSLNIHRPSIHLSVWFVGDCWDREVHLEAVGVPLRDGRGWREEPGPTERSTRDRANGPEPGGEADRGGINHSQHDVDRWVRGGGGSYFA